MGGINFSKFGKVGAPLARAGAHGLTQGGFSALRGGNFWHGFASGTIGSLASTSSQGIDSFGAKVAISSTAGGASSAVAGGSFTDGAVTGAYVYLFNHHAHQIETNARIKKENRKNGSGALRWQRDTNGGDNYDGGFKDISDPENYPEVNIYETDYMAEGTGVTLLGIGIFIHSSVKGRNRESMLQHEYGHFLDYKLSPDLNYNPNSPSSTLNFYIMIGIPSILNLTPGFNQIPRLDGRHRDFYTEKRADKWGKIFFGDNWLGH